MFSSFSSPRGQRISRRMALPRSRLLLPAFPQCLSKCFGRGRAPTRRPAELADFLLTVLSTVSTVPAYPVGWPIEIRGNEVIPRRLTAVSTAARRDRSTSQRAVAAYLTVQETGHRSRPESVALLKD